MRALAVVAARPAGRGRAVEERERWIEQVGRSLSALTGTAVRYSFLRRALGEVLAYAEQDESVLLELLSSPSQLLPHPRPARWAAVTPAVLALLDEEGGGLGAAEVASRLGLSRQAVYLRRRAGRLLAVPGPRGEVFPAWQIVDGETLPGLERVLEVLDGVPAAQALQFFLSPLDELDGARPVDLLRAGRVEEVRRVAGGWGG
jgi:hypothetical protein